MSGQIERVECFTYINSTHQSLKVEVNPLTDLQHEHYDKAQDLYDRFLFLV